MKPTRDPAGMRHMVLALCMTAIFFAGGCIYTGRSPRNDPVARSPLGVHGQIRVGRDRYAGELLAITSNDFVLLTDRVVVIPFAIAGVGDFGSIDIGTYGAPWQIHAEQLRYASRYPYGIPAEALDAILRQHGQTAPDTAKLTGL
jgi:hypothetical protein